MRRQTDRSVNACRFRRESFASTFLSDLTIYELRSVVLSLPRLSSPSSLLYDIKISQKRIKSAYQDGLCNHAWPSHRDLAWIDPNKVMTVIIILCLFKGRSYLLLHFFLPLMMHSLADDFDATLVVCLCLLPGIN